MPAFGLGTWKSPKGEVSKAVAEALTVGYTHVDAAWIYQNEQAVGAGISEAIKAGVIARDSLFVTSKLWNTFHQPEAVEKGCKESLDALGLDYLDLYLMHWPVAFKPGKSQHNSADDFYSLSELPLSKTFEAMSQLREQGLVKSVGVSNFSISKIEKVIAEAGIVPAINQVEMHPYNPQNELLDYCHDQGIHVTAYSPLGSGDRPASLKAKDEPPLLENEDVKAIATEENLSPAQLLIAWALDRGTIVIPKSTNAKRISENLAAVEHTLSSDARTALDNIGIQHRYVNVSDWYIPGVTYEGSDFWS
ncbi:oxidoreductase, aldo/keto reductase family [Synechococcus sp. PCC 7335]|nr:oxidoreductase, aldo/keto reductase family [Synechococcus sp. PCC 7335]